MNFKRIGMALVSLVLVACLIVNVTPIKAEATSAVIAATTVAVPGAAVIGACLVGLGVLVGVATTDWDNVVDNAVEYYKEQGVIGEDGNMDIYSLTNAGYQYGVAEGMLSGLKDWLFENEVLTETSVTVPSGYWLYNGLQYKPLPSYDTSLYRYAAIVTNSASNQTGLYVSTLPLGFSGQDSGKTNLVNINSSQVDGLYFVYSRGNWSTAGTSFSYDAHTAIVSYSWRITWRWANYDITNADGSVLQLAASEPVKESSSSISINGDLIMGEIASAADSISAGYSQWANNAVDALTNDADLTAVYPIAYSAGQTLDAVRALTQDEVWTGVISGTTLPDEDVTPTPDIGDISVALGDVTTSVFLNSLADLIETLPLIPPDIEDAIEQLPIYLGDIRDYIETLPRWQDTLLDHIEQLPISIRDIRDYIETLPRYQDDIRNYIEQFPDRLSTAFGDVKVGVRTITDTLTRTLEETKAIALERVGVITDAATRVFLPSEGYVDAKVDALTAKFPIVESIQTTGDDLKDFMLGLGQRPPIIYIDLGAQRGFHNIGGKVAFIDLSWYAEYKPTMDAILSAFLWLWFAWRVFLSAPGILQGAAGVWQRYESHAGKDTWNSNQFSVKAGSSEYITPFGWSEGQGWHEFKPIKNPNRKHK